MGKGRFETAAFFNMATLKQLYNRIKKVDVNTIVEDTMEQAAPLITLQQREQMKSGLNNEGKQIGRYRNPAYARKKNSMNPLPGLGIPDLRLTGEFYRGIYTDVRGDKLVIDGAEEKTQKLVDKYGENIFGLNPDSKVEVIKEIRPVFINNMKKETGL